MNDERKFEFEIGGVEIAIDIDQFSANMVLTVKWLETVTSLHTEKQNLAAAWAAYGILRDYIIAAKFTVQSVLKTGAFPGEEHIYLEMLHKMDEIEEELFVSIAILNDFQAGFPGMVKEEEE